MSDPSDPRPLAGGSFDTCPIEDLIAAYENSPATPTNPTATARVYVLPDGKGMAEGGDLRISKYFKARKAEIVDHLTAPCADCGERLATQPVAVLTPNRRRVCNDCYQTLIEAADTSTVDPTSQPGHA